MKRFILFFTLCLNHMTYPEGFIAGTPVKTPTGYVPIEQIRPGDQVISLAPEWEKGCCIGRVIQVIKQYTETLVKVTTDNESFFTTPDQFFVFGFFPNMILYGTPDTEWIAVTNLKCGDRIFTAATESTDPKTGERFFDHEKDCTISSVELVDACAEIYTLSVAKYGNFCVSTHDVFAHNFVPCVALAGPAAAPFAVAAAPVIGGATVCAAVGYGIYRIWKSVKEGRPPSEQAPRSISSCGGGGGPPPPPWWENGGGHKPSGKLQKGNNDCRDLGQKSTQELVRAKRALENQALVHRIKLNEYTLNPFEHDNKGFLKSASTPEMIKNIIDSRIKHLKGEIRLFEKQVGEVANELLKRGKK